MAKTGLGLVSRICACLFDLDGKPGEDGIRSFLASRSVELPKGTARDPSSADTVHGLGKRKNTPLAAWSIMEF